MEYVVLEGMRRKSLGEEASTMQDASATVSHLALKTSWIVSGICLCDIVYCKFVSLFLKVRQQVSMRWLFKSSSTECEHKQIDNKEREREQGGRGMTRIGGRAVAGEGEQLRRRARRGGEDGQERARGKAITEWQMGEVDQRR
jgi:hypothetical protein